MNKKKTTILLVAGFIGCLYHISNAAINCPKGVQFGMRSPVSSLVPKGQTVSFSYSADIDVYLNGITSTPYIWKELPALSVIPRTTNHTISDGKIKTHTIQRSFSLAIPNQNNWSIVMKHVYGVQASKCAGSDTQSYQKTYYTN